MAEKVEANPKKKKLTAEAEKSTEKDEPKLKKAKKEEEPTNELIEVVNLPQAAVMKFVKESVLFFICFFLLITNNSAIQF